MSEENNEELVLVHEDYIDEKGIDESTLPTEIVNDIKDVDTMIDTYNGLPEDDPQNDELLKSIETKSKLIKAAIVSWEVNKPADPIDPKVEPKVEPTSGENPPKPADPIDPKVEPKEKEPKPKKDESSDYFSWMDV